MAKKKGDYQPAKYDWIALEAEFMSGDEPSVAKFFRARGIPKKTYEKGAVGWGEKRTLMKQRGLKAFENRLAKEMADHAETELIFKKGLFKKSSDALFGPDGKSGLVPKTAREAAQLALVATQIGRQTLSDMREAVRVEVSTVQPANGQEVTGPQVPGEDVPKVVTVSIRLPAKNPPLE